MFTRLMETGLYSKLTRRLSDADLSFCLLIKLLSCSQSSLARGFNHLSKIKLCIVCTRFENISTDFLQISAGFSESWSICMHFIPFLLESIKFNATFRILHKFLSDFARIWCLTFPKTSKNVENLEQKNFTGFYGKFSENRISRVFSHNLMELHKLPSDFIKSNKNL